MSNSELIKSQVYGWGVIYALTVEGIDVVFTERETGLTLPGSGPFTQSTEDASLVIDTSGPIGGQVDRSAGIGTGLSLGFALLDTATVRSNLLAPTYTSRLAADVTPTATTITVDDASGWPASGTFWAGIERITYTGTTATTFTGCTRGTLGKAFAHGQGSSSSILTSSPRWWVGREATLWAVAVDPAGHVAGSTFGDVGYVICLWRGYIKVGPQRIAQGFRFEASALDRRLARDLQAVATGKIVSTAARFAVDPNEQFAILIERWSGAILQWSHLVQFEPFASLSTANRYAGSQLRSLVRSTFATALAALGAPATSRIEELYWQPDETQGTKRYFANIKLYAQTSGDQFRIYHVGAQSKYVLGGSTTTDLPQQISTLPVHCDLLWGTYDSPTESLTQSQNGIRGLTIELDDGTPGVVVAPATVTIDLGENTKGTITAAYVDDAEGLLYVGTFISADAAAQAATNIVGKSASVRFVADGDCKTVILEHLHSSGTAALRDATYDVLPRSQGYGLETSRVNQDSFDRVNQGPLAALQLQTSTGSNSAQALFAGLLSLSRLAIAARPDFSDDYRQIKITCVGTSLGNSAGIVEITDNDLLSLSATPVEVLDRAVPANVVKLELEEGQSITYTDQAAADTFGTNEQSWKIPHPDRDTIYAIATPMVASFFATQPTLQTFKLRVSQQIDVHVGDVVQLQLTHPAIYDWGSGTAGYTGSAVVLGRSFDLRTKAVELIVAASAQLTGRALSPSAVVTAYSAGTSITVDRGWYEHFHATHEKDGVFKVAVYLPGNSEALTDGFEIRAVTDTGSACVLTIQGSFGAPSVTVGGTNPSRLTFTEHGDATQYQQGFAFTDQGGFWL